ncbi:related to YAP1 - transcriptional activator involved in oxidative stress response [Cephalotrichum gorgonifer]|uniref:Related to YAP1 - transcriptional activator involved in oxidative stress response n=1 Tax=Cephalotrichum gorgonifer TaxID=2041049 RepID=A0AAE8SWQ2_9PEZI|nr:related to YAP1 - transcriptional activator involved in oxidative stress response [Cephalotrichum gorgonifer]
MDYSQQQYFGGAQEPQQQPYHQYMGIAPLTPSNSHSAASDDFNNTSPPEVFDQFPSDQPYQPFDGGFRPHFNQPAFPGPPTPPNQAGQAGHLVLNGDSQAVKQLPLDGLAAGKTEPGAEDSLHTQTLLAQQQARRGQSNSDEDDMTPAQSRRKAQNRAAQRAFRERKERHVKDLENRLASLEDAQNLTANENERLKRDLQKMNTENEILRATSGIPHNSSAPNSSLSPEPTTTGPLHYNPTDFYTNVLSLHENKTPSHRIVTSEDGEKLLAAGATWDLIISHELFKKGLVDIGDVSERLKHKARCDGMGPVFLESVIIEAVESSVASGSDELL